LNWLVAEENKTIERTENSKLKAQQSRERELDE